MDKLTRFNNVVHEYGPRFMKDMNVDIDTCAAVFGNLGWESDGFTAMQERKPIAGRGGWGWPQWTGPRRTAFEAWCKKMALDTAADETNYRYLCIELKTTEKKAIPAASSAASLYDKVVAFELNFERAGAKYKNYPGRLEWAQRARTVLNGMTEPGPVATTTTTTTTTSQPTVPVQPTGSRSIVVTVFMVLAALGAYLLHWIGFGGH